MRINKYLTQSGFCSRRKADELIEKKLVKINDRVAVLGDQVGESDKVFVEGKEIKNENDKVYLMYNKPLGVVCTTDLKEKDNIISTINYPTRIFPIGRLDKFSTGLILLTNDGDIVNKILRAQFGHEKEYVVNIDKPFEKYFLKKMASGVDIGDHVTLKCRVEPINRSTFNIVLTEGKNRQIRRMCEALGYKVRHLNRVRIMNIELGNLEVGKYQKVPQKKLDELFKLIELKSHKLSPDQDDIIEE